MTLQNLFVLVAVATLASACSHQLPPVTAATQETYGPPAPPIKVKAHPTPNGQKISATIPGLGGSLICYYKDGKLLLSTRVEPDGSTFENFSLDTNRGRISAFVMELPVEYRSDGVLLPAGTYSGIESEGRIPTIRGDIGLVQQGDMQPIADAAWSSGHLCGELAHKNTVDGWRVALRQPANPGDYRLAASRILTLATAAGATLPLTNPAPPPPTLGR